MTLIRVSKTVLINPEFISSIEQRTMKNKDTLVVWVDGKSYIIEIPIKEFLQSLDNLTFTSNDQFFAG